MSETLVYVAISPELAASLELDTELARLEGRARVERWAGPGDPPPETVATALERADVLLTGWRTPYLAPLEDWAPGRSRLRLVAHSAGTIKHLVPRAALERGLPLTHANLALAESVAEFTIGAIIMARRQAFAARDRLRNHLPPVDPTSQHEIAGSTVGVIGASAIGERVLRLLAPLGAERLLYDPYCPPERAAALGGRLVGLHELLRRSDVVTLHAPVTPETLGMLGAPEFAAMKDGALFVNTARGRLIDHAALLRELQAGRLFALLDVTDPEEPLPPDSPFYTLENCVVLPHMAAVTVEARRRQSAYTVDEILRFLDGEPLRFQVTPARWDTMA
ncbi:MAG TPA: hydroxyacid dehydrogenase [Roseiflexaceae bacterium]|nr:hydroxyacid dehydrogenase [Roseiflexaceae bacterium]